MTLRALDGRNCTTHTLLCRGEVLFAFLAPGEYRLTLCRAACRWLCTIQLVPGGNVVLDLCPRRGTCRWQLDRCHYFFNLH